MSARRCSRVAKTVDARPSNPTSATACMFVTWAARPRKTSALTTRRRSSCVACHRRLSLPSRPSRGTRRRPKNRSAIWLAVFSSRRACGCNSSNRASAVSRSDSSKTSQRSIRSPSTVRSKTIRHSPSKPSGEAPFAVIGGDRSETTEPVHRLAVDAEVWRDLPNPQGCF